MRQPSSRSMATTPPRACSARCQEDTTSHRPGWRRAMRWAQPTPGPTAPASFAVALRVVVRWSRVSALEQVDDQDDQDDGGDHADHDERDLGLADRGLAADLSGLPVHDAAVEVALVL